MNNGPITLIVIAGFGLIAVLSLGLFFALKPRTSVTTTWFSFSEQGNKQRQNTHQPTEGFTATETFTEAIDPLTTTSGNLEKRWYTPPRKTTATTISTTTSALLPTTSGVSTVKKASVHGVEDLQRVDVVEFQPPSEAEIESIEDNNRPPVQNQFFGSKDQWIKWVSEIKLDQEGRIVGLAYQNKHLFAASIRTGNITVLSTPDLSVVDVVPCPRCHAYDVAVFRNGDMVVAQGKRRKLTKISRRKRIVRQLGLSYATKGLAVSPRQFVYVLARTHDKVYRYDRHLNPAGMIPIPNHARDDCNFLAIGKNERLYVSCENKVFIIGSRGNLVGTVEPIRGSYSVGIGVDGRGNILVVRRGKSQIDVLDSDGNLKKTMGADEDRLWSDLAVGEHHAYIVDYMGITVKGMEYS